MAKTMFEPTGACGRNAADNISSSTIKSCTIIYSLPANSAEAQNLFLRLVKQYAEREGVTEQLKAVNQMEWVRSMNNIRSQVIEYTGKELIYI